MPLSARRMTRICGMCITSFQRSVLPTSRNPLCMRLICYQGDEVRALALRKVQTVSSTGSTDSFRVRVQLSIQVEKVVSLVSSRHKTSVSRRRRPISPQRPRAPLLQEGRRKSQQRLCRSQEGSSTRTTMSGWARTTPWTSRVGRVSPCIKSESS